MEDAVATFLTLDGCVFIAPQYQVAYNQEEKDGGTFPDFVAMDFSRREVVIVEVTEAWNTGDLLAKVADRERRWFNPIRRTLMQKDMVGKDWPMRFLGFLRQDRVSAATKRFQGFNDVGFYALEDAVLSYRYHDHRMKNGLPR